MSYEARDVLVKGGVADGEWIVALGTQKLDTRQAPVLILQGNAAKLRRTRRFTGQKSSSSEDHKMGRFNLSAWAVRHPPLVPFLILMLAVAGTFSYLKLRLAEDANFTIKVAVVTTIWPGATAGNAGSGCGPDRKEAAGNGYVSQERVNQAAKDSYDRELSFASHDAASPAMRPAARSGPTPTG